MFHFLPDWVVLVGGVILLGFVLDLRSRVRELETLVRRDKRPAASETEDLTLSTPAQAPALPLSATGEGPRDTPLPDPFSPTPEEGAGAHYTQESARGKWLGEDWMLKLGALLVLIGFGWLVTYAFMNNWIGPIGRISLSLIAGSLFMLVGWYRMKISSSQGSVFLVLGSTTILLTLFAARIWYDFFTPLSALSLMFLSTVFVTLVSVKYHRRSLALAALVLAFIAPLLTGASSPNYTALFAYLLVTVSGVLWVVVFTGWRKLTLAALVAVIFYSMPHLTSFSIADTGVLLLFAYAFTALFFLINTGGMLKLKGKELVPDLITAAGNGIFLLWWITQAAQEEWQSLIITAWTLVFVITAFLIFKITRRREPFLVYAGIGAVLLAAAISLELEGAARIILSAERPLTSSRLTLLLDNNVALPTSVAVRAHE